MVVAGALTDVGASRNGNIRARVVRLCMERMTGRTGIRYRDCDPRYWPSYGQTALRDRGRAPPTVVDEMPFLAIVWFRQRCRQGESSYVGKLYLEEHDEDGRDAANHTGRSVV